MTISKKEICKPIKLINFKIKPKGFLSWGIEHINPSISILPNSLESIDETSMNFLDYDKIFDLVKNRIEFKIGLAFKF